MNIPRWWWVRAAKLSQPACRVAVMLLQLRFIRKANTVKLESAFDKAHDLDRNTKYRGLRKLEEAGLLRVTDRKRGRLPTVELLGIPPPPKRG